MPKILAVDDSKSMRQMVTMSLTSAGHQVVEAEDGAAALNIAKQEQFDVVVTDINMPNMNGIELITALRALPNYKFTPILCLTTESSGDMKVKGKDAGATGWIVKPFSPEKLLSVISRVI
ncbi:Fis family transcriptional regulator [Thiomicrospira aerophila AL3]|uniref:Fis family transcriptional regulator n=1 Tax=Thiomicrospira aerophila AL3 TaxID=717772 RepID=W0DWG5_9GAMM|nr:response regulator [Thiomicrospira aerophila]AHF01191.1 Fis family transcriptional regulator [Thiomicrospira aerophila AL3]